MKFKGTMLYILVAVSTNLVSCGPSQEEIDDQVTLTAEAQVATRTQFYIETETARPPLTSTNTPIHTITPTETPVLIVDKNLSSSTSTGSSTDLELTSIHMINETDGWGLQESAVWITRDGGHVWCEVTPERELTDEEPFEVHGGFVDANHAWLIFEKIDREYDVPPISSVLFTKDGGETWRSSQPLDIDLGGLSPKISFVPTDNHTGWLRIGGFGGGGVLVANQFRTTDGGETWDLCDSTGPCDIPNIDPNAMSDMAFTDDQHGWLLESSINESPIRYHETNDGGREWIAHTLPAPSELDHSSWCSLDDLSLLDDGIARFYVRCTDYRRDTGEASHFDPYLYATEDGGETWHVHSLPTTGWMRHFDRYNGLLFRDGMWRTQDGGATWQRINTVIWDGQFSFIDAWHGWAVAESEDDEIALVNTTNGGESWKILNPVAFTEPAPASENNSAQPTDTAAALSERNVLVTLYQETDGENWANNTNWLSDRPICDWYGITCTNGHVLEIVLMSNGLKGKLPPEIGQLTNLDYLNLKNNELTGLPPEIGQLSNLLGLILSNNQLTELPEEIGQLSNLYWLWLDGNLLTELPSEICQLPNLVVEPASLCP